MKLAVNAMQVVPPNTTVTVVANSATNPTKANPYTLSVATSADTTASTSGSYTIMAGEVDASHSTVAASPASVPADGSTTSSVTVTLSDINGNPVSGKTVSLAANGGGSVITPASGISTATGEVTFTVKDAKPESVIYTATDTTDSVPIAQTATVTFAGPGDASHSTVAASPASVPADGSTASTVTVTVKDANGNPVSGKTVSLAANGGGSVITPASGISTATGEVTFTAKDATPESVAYTATDSTDSVTVAQTATVTFTGPGDASHSTVAASPASVPADGSTASTVTVTVKD
ncbi:MAG: Ig-like domain-containing protein, partial [Acidimicrobiales bacterium]